VDAGGPDPAARSPSEDATASQVLDETAEMHNSTKHMPLPMTSSATKMSSESTQVKFQDPIESTQVLIFFFFITCVNVLFRTFSELL